MQCNIHKDGVCAMHNVEVERRTNTDRKTDVLPGIIAKINYMFGYAALASLVLIGAFYYTQETRAEAIDRDLKLREAIVMVDSKTEIKLRQLTVEVKKLTIAMIKNETRHEALIEKVESMMDYMTLLIRTKHPETEVPDPRGN